MSSVVVTSNLYLVRSSSLEAMEKAAEKVGILVQGDAKDMCPVDTGRMQESITYQTESGESTVELQVGVPADVYYAPYVELGHHQKPGRYVPAIGKRLVRSWVPGKPFLRPAFENNIGEIEQIIISCFDS